MGVTDPDESQEFIKATKMGKVDKKASSSNAEANQQQLAKKPFDKKKWRENKYSHKAKVNKFNDRRNQSIQNKYFKMLKKSGDGSNTAGSKKDTRDGSGKPSGGSFKMAKLDFERRKKKAE